MTDDARKAVKKWADLFARARTFALAPADVCAWQKLTNEKRPAWGHPVLGLIQHEGDGWYWTPRERTTWDRPPAGPFATLREAFRAATLGGTCGQPTDAALAGTEDTDDH